MPDPVPGPEVDALITHRLLLEDVIEQGFERLVSGDRSAIKILANPAEVYRATFRTPAHFA